MLQTLVVVESLSPSKMEISFKELRIKPATFYLGEVISLIGPDSVSFLNSQVTSDVVNLPEGEFQHSVSYLS